MAVSYLVYFNATKVGPQQLQQFLDGRKHRIALTLPPPQEEVVSAHITWYAEPGVLHCTSLYREEIVHALLCKTFGRVAIRAFHKVIGAFTIGQQ